MLQRLRRSPPVCMLVALGCLLTGRLRFPAKHVGRRLQSEEGEPFTVFRHMTRRAPPGQSTALFSVRFKFARFSQATNRWLSLIPVLMIAGYPGFRDKLWLVNEETGYWEGLYQWESPAAVEAYRSSFVLGLMNRRALPGSLTARVLPETTLEDHLASRG